MLTRPQTPRPRPHPHVAAVQPVPDNAQRMNQHLRSSQVLAISLTVVNSHWTATQWWTVIVKRNGWMLLLMYRSFTASAKAKARTWPARPRPRPRLNVTDSRWTEKEPRLWVCYHWSVIMSTIDKRNRHMTSFIIRGTDALSPAGGRLILGVVNIVIKVVNRFSERIPPIVV